uniref:NADH dehydrogenase I chain 4 (Or M) n=1 Tax=Paulinella longichromatophora TaxID=1708747 RepID=A0A2H4ZP62_9EUKA|nr:NADH dehydrogenase I chain 4 (or M) [Paulinella longichromatophora]
MDLMNTTFYTNVPWLTISIAVPAIGALFVPIIFSRKSPKKHPKNVSESDDVYAMERLRWYSLFFTSISFCCTILGYITQYDPEISGLQLIEKWEWIPILHLNWSLGADGLSMPLILLSSFITNLAIFASWQVFYKPRLFFFLMLLMSAGQIAVFAAQNMILFFLTWELELVPVYLLLAIWGGKYRQDAATKFILYTAISSIFILIAAWAMGSQNGNIPSYEYTDLVAVSLDRKSQIFCYSALLIAFGVKLPVVPLHTWLPDAHGQATAPVHMLLAGILLKMGGYALFRFNAQMLPEAHSVFAPLLVILGAVNIVYAALSSFATDDLKKKVAYSSISHMGFVLIGLGSLSDLGASGAMLQMISHGLIGASLFYLVGAIYDRTGTLVIDQMLGIGKRMKQIFALWTISCLASLALPGMSGFVAEVMVLTGFITSESYTLGFRVIITTIAALGVIITPAYLLSVTRNVFFGEYVVNKNNDLEYYKNTYIDADPREIYITSCLIIPVIIIGLYPRVVTDSYKASIEALIRLDTTAANKIASDSFTRLVRQVPLLQAPSLIDSP